MNSGSARVVLAPIPQQHRVRARTRSVFSLSSGRQHPYGREQTPSREQNMASSGYLYSLLAEDGAWQVEKAVALHKALKDLTVLLAIADSGRLQKGLKGRQKFLKVFPRLKAELADHISQLHALADHFEKLHKSCAISNVVADSFSAASNVLDLLGLFLAPVTAEGSLVLSATGLGLGVAATVTNVATSIMEERSRVLDEVEAAPTGMLGEADTSVTRVSSKVSWAARDITRDLEALEQHMNALRLVRANPHLEEDAKILAAMGSISAQRATQVRASLKGTPLAMSHEARIQRATAAGAALWRDVGSLVKESKHLSASEALRKLARELEEKLEGLTEFYKTI
ncbi:apolipoprotein L2-like isoform X2 [Mus pahari]|uniref:apolipoprotein L2-like isoform X2 n=1 Tax=Mus pahari TaxID=10093 RepID=UPI0011147C4E|nr:apolipoprotein L2-like isoform X2 [Mus pahari]